MNDIYSRIMLQFNKRTLLPILSVSVLLLSFLFLLNEYQASAHKNALIKTTKENFSNIAKATSIFITDEFKNGKNITNILQTMLQHDFKYQDSMPMLLNKNDFYSEKGFFKYSISGNKNNILLYTTNIDTLDKNDLKVLNVLLYTYSNIKKSIDIQHDFISSAWVNIGKKYILAYPGVDLSKILSDTVDVTKEPSYYLADKQHNPFRQTVFIPLYNQPQAISLGEVGAFVAPIYRDSHMVGVVGLTLHIRLLYKMLSLIKFQQKAFAVIVDDQNHIILSSNSKEATKALHVSSFYQKYLEHASHVSLQSADLSQLDVNYISHIVQIPHTSLKLIIASRKSDVFQEIEQEHDTIAFSGLVVLFVIIIFFIFVYFYTREGIRKLASNISKPLQQIVRFSSALGQKKEFELDDSNIVELSALVKNLNTTHNKLLDMIIYDEQIHIYNKRKLQQDMDHIDTLMLLSIDNYQSLQYIYGDDVAADLLAGIVLEIQKHSDITLYRVHENMFALAMPGFDFNRLRILYSSLKMKKIKCNNLRLHAVLFGGMASKQDSKNLLEDAQIALLYAQNNKISSFVTYKDAEQIKDEFYKNMKWSTRLSDAFLENRLEAYFQPVYDIKNKKIEKFEALVRLNENGKVIAPYFFLEAAKNMGRIHDITLFMIKSVFQTASRYKQISFNINLSFKDFDDHEFLDYVQGTCEFYNVDPKNITFELLETDTLEHIDISVKAINKLKEMGFLIAIDDFGTGNSNFAHLMTMNVDYIKIDGQFIKDITENPISENITRTIIKFSKLVGAKTVAEFVCNDDVFKFIKELGIDYAQGYAISRPVKVTQIDDLIAREFEE